MTANPFNSAILAGIESVANHLLKLDSKSSGKLYPLSGKILQIQCEIPAITINMQINDDRIMLHQEQDTKADTSIRGNATALMKLLLTRNTNNLHKDGVTITGNTSFLSTLQDILSSMNVDWEYQLSQFIGDIPTQAISDGLSASGKFAERTKNNIQQDLDDYLHEEKKIFPSETEVEGFYAAVNKLRLRTDRLEARLNRLLKAENP